MNHDLAVGGGLEDGPFFLHHHPQCAHIDKVAVMGRSELAFFVFDQNGLCVDHLGVSGGRIPVVTQRDMAFQMFEFCAVFERFRH
ncbi:uncharacterized protein METZ01_LOCUS265251 [marine metagenome]|uniref:Uncharacterized protein n=1 Tax=marine metagenome TaxID=408172 RepID=A0A382JMU0_9ZZZZ